MDQILAEEAVDNGADETVQWTLTHHLHTVPDIAKYDPGEDMTTVVNHLIYDAFSGVTDETNPAVDRLFLFTARLFDSDSQLQNNLNRWYAPAIGRWLSEDPIGFGGGDGNLYRYVGNAVCRETDSDGLQTQGQRPNDKRLGGLGYYAGQEWLCNLCCHDKVSRLRSISGIRPLTRHIPQGPSGGYNQTRPFPSDDGLPIGGGGAAPCIILIVKCPAVVKVFHFSVGDSPTATLQRFGWDPHCQAVICGGDDSGQSNCLADDVIRSVNNAGITLVGVSAASGCGVTAEGGWYEVA